MDSYLKTLCGDHASEFLHHGFNSTVPHISECAQAVVLAIFPCIFLFIFSPLVLYSLYKSDNGPLECCSPVLCRIVVCVLLSCNTAFLLFYGLYEWKTGVGTSRPWSVLAPAVQYLAICYALVLMIACRNRGVITSGVLFNFWLVMAICGFPEFRWRIDTARAYGEAEFDRVRFIIYMMYYPMVLIELMLSCFADTPMYRINDKTVCPEESCSYLNQITFHWFNSLAVKGNKRALQISDLWKLNARDESQHLVPAFNKNWKPALLAYCERKRAAMKASPPAILSEKEMPSVLWPLFKTYRLEFIGGAALKLVFDLLQFVAPQLLKSLISFIEDKSSPVWIGVWISLLMFFVALFQSLILHQYFHIMFTLGMNIRSVLTSAVYSKALALSNSARKNRTVGEIVNLMSVDIQRFQDMTTFIMLFWSAPLQVILAIYFLWRLLGVSVIAGLFILIAMVPFNSWISIRMKNFQVEQMKFKDERLKLMSEILNGMKVLKLYAWENSMQKMILEIRQKEINVLRRLAFYNAAATLSWSCAPFLVAVFTFGVYVNISSENILTPQVTFVGLSLFNILRFPLAVFAMIFSQAVQCVVSNKRLKSFLADDEMEHFVIDGSSSHGAAVIQDGSFSWDSSEMTLKDINLKINKGELVAVVGRVGCGKSSLLSALLGEMDKQKGEVLLSGSVAYVPQQAWIQNMTLRDNIIFNKNYVSDRYNKIIDACALTPDLAALPAGDATEIGEKGINLSGGQKQRVSLARAVYADADIVLLDDPLSAVDAHVGKHIFDNVISSESGLLAGKTRILVTHGLHFLKHCDQIVVMKDGSISETGTFEELMSSQGAFADFLEEFLVEEAKNRARSVSFGEQAEEVDEVLRELERFDPAKRQRIESQLSQATASSQESLDHSARSPSPRVQQKGLDLVSPLAANGKTSNETEYVKQGGIMVDGKEEKEQLLKDGRFISANEKSKLISKEAVEIGKVKWTVYVAYIKAIGYFITFLFFSIYVISSVLGVLSNLWLADWSDRAKERNETSSEGDSTNLRLAVYAALGVGQAAFVCAASIIMALGMVLASRSLHEGILRNILHSPMSFFDVTPLGRILNRFGKDMDVVDSSLPHCSRSFVSTVLSVFMTIVVIVYATPTFSTVIPILSIVYYLVLRFYVSTSRQLKRLESTTRSPIYSHFQESVQGAACIRAYRCVDHFIGESQRRVDDNLATYYPSIVANRWLAVRLEIIGNLIVFCSAIFAVLYRNNGTVTAGLVGLSVSYALNITQTLNWAVRMTSELETNIVAVERLKEYAETPTEGSEDERKPPLDWPSRGEITIENLDLRYRDNLDYVLRDVSAHILPGEKVGIVGRTGAGKSSLTLALFRIVEPEAGRIVIDNEDISKLSLEALRSKLTIVPQDPVLFSGTLRMNLDPFERFNDDTVWDALKMAHLEPFVCSLVDRLQHRITEGGENLSVGQRQLVCLARALLRKTKILILDEAAASVDMETDALIQKTIREQFESCTVLTIAHRLNTVIDNNRLLVLDGGRVKEFDDPSQLLEDHSSLFFAMAKESGLVQ